MALLTNTVVDLSTKNEVNDTVGHTWSLAGIFVASPRVINYSAILSNKTVDLLNRAQSKTIEFPEWIFLLYCLKHYRNSVKTFLSL